MSKWSAGVKALSAGKITLDKLYPYGMRHKPAEARTLCFKKIFIATLIAVGNVTI